MSTTPIIRKIPWRTLAKAILSALIVGLLLLVLLAASRARLDAPGPTPLVRARDGRFLTEVGDDVFGYWPVSPFPPRVAAATLAIEDRRFWRHIGVDPVGVGRSVVQNFRAGKRLSGASTLAMQIARLQNPGPRTYFRKATEALTAMMLTARYGRESILEHYLRIIPYGNRIHGISYAARRYLDKPVDDLSWAEIAFLAAIPQAPAHMNPFTPLGRSRAVARGNRILDELLARGALSKDEYTLARHEISRLRVLAREDRPLDAMHAVLRLEEALKAPETRATLQDRPLVVSTLDPEIQGTVADLTIKAFRRWERDGAGNIAVMVVDRRNYEVRAALGSVGYFEARHQGAIDYTRVPRQPGSALKPFIYGLALDQGLITPATVLDDIHRGPEGLSNSDDRFLGPLLPRVALANSRNVPAVKLFAEIGLDVGYAFFERLAFHHNELPAKHYGLAMAIGGLPVTLEQLMRAYTALAGDGRMFALKWYEGQVLEPPRRVLTEETARLITLFLSDPAARLPTFPRMGASEYAFPVAVKTGTSADYRDAWSIDYSSRYLVGVWLGHPDYRPMKQLSGFNSAAHLTQEILNYLHQDERSGLSDLSFPAPGGYVARRVCTLSGQLAGEACDKAMLEWFAPGQAPVQTCTIHVRLAVDVRTGSPATSSTPPEQVEVRTFLDLAPKYAAWAASRGLPTAPDFLRHETTTAGAAWHTEGEGAGDSRANGGVVTDSVDEGTMADSRQSAGLPGSSSDDDLPALSYGKTVTVRITSPEADSRLLRDPEVPEGMGTVALEAVADPPVEQLVWYVDGKPYRVVDYPYETRWSIRPGIHTFEARVPFTHFVSSPVQVRLE